MRHAAGTGSRRRRRTISLRTRQSFEQHLWPLLAAPHPGFEAARCSRSWVGHYDYNTFDQNAFVGAVPTAGNLLIAMRLQRSRSAAGTGRRTRARRTDRARRLPLARSRAAGLQRYLARAARRIQRHLVHGAAHELAEPRVTGVGLGAAMPEQVDTTFLQQTRRQRDVADRDETTPAASASGSGRIATSRVPGSRNATPSTLSVTTRRSSSTPSWRRITSRPATYHPAARRRPAAT